MTVVVVTDSSACLPAEQRERWGIRCVPLHVLCRDTDLRDGVDEMPADIYHCDQASTSAAAPAEIAEVYRAALGDSGGDGVVAVHLSGELSGTLRTARLTAVELGPPVQVIDSRSTAMGAGFVALAAARAAAEGAGLAEVAAVAEAAVRRGHSYLVVQRLDNLRRSGRIGGAAAWLGTALSLKPLLRIDDGRLVLAQRIRTGGRAVAALIDRVCDDIGDRPAELAVHHVDNPRGAADLAAALAERLPHCPPALITDLGPVLGLHVGAGALAVCLSVAEPVVQTGNGNPIHSAG